MTARELFRRRRLPHWDLPGAIYFVTSCLYGSIPARGLLDVDAYRRRLQRRPRQEGVAEADWNSRLWKWTFARSDKWLDQWPAVRHLADPRLADRVRESVYCFVGDHYDLIAYVVMPSHLHWVFRPRDEWAQRLGSAPDQRTPRERIMHSLKRFTALECNKILARQGTFWQDESYDHCVLDVEELERVIHYVERNPVRAGLVAAPEQWPFSSAKDRADQNLPFGQPLPRPVGQVCNLPNDNRQVENLPHGGAGGA